MQTESLPHRPTIAMPPFDAEQLAQIERAGRPVLWPEDAPEPEGEAEWPEALEELV